jgi:hypothetical protein
VTRITRKGGYESCQLEKDVLSLKVEEGDDDDTCVFNVQEATDVLPTDGELSHSLLDVTSTVLDTSVKAPTIPVCDTTTSIDGMSPLAERLLVTVTLDAIEAPGRYLLRKILPCHDTLMAPPTWLRDESIHIR